MPDRAREKSKPRRTVRGALRQLGRSKAAIAVAGVAVGGLLRFVHATQRRAAGSSDFRRILTEEHPAIVGLWHGQHLLAPFFRPRELPFVALLSRNADAEINARVVESFGISTVRGSGGREGVKAKRAKRKGGARALVALRHLLAGGTGVCMIADIPKGTPRDAGLGIVTLAKISGRPIIPAGAVTSRHRVVARAWDKTRIPLPFGRIAVVMGAPIVVPADADEAMMEAKRREVTAAIEAANLAAERLVGTRR
ncbi:lysophospholipid acyltransferase family protein [Jiella pelagia]|uniref:Lysophospholipid acyltransferase family protein n=1 Tax=Jiella pelagia TaxID=2986949 RepID=A0ABY7BVG3_9HYPH|nr:lysophospholipid acyltransferase family protein [Jiella pelagia]WAP67337.1 lysophospholipid acyltransferase family protein [Jiella pelagia]